MPKKLHRDTARTAITGKPDAEKAEDICKKETDTDSNYPRENCPVSYCAVNHRRQNDYSGPENGAYHQTAQHKRSRFFCCMASPYSYNYFPLHGSFR